MVDLGIKNKIALVTGASKGIGRGIAVGLANEGAKMLLVARSAVELESLRQEISINGADHHCFVIDLMSANGPASLIAEINEKGLNPEIIVHNLGGSLGISNIFASTEDWQRVWRLNVGIGHELNCEFVPAMIKNNWGRIVHLSTLSTTTYSGNAPYVSAKCALDGYIKTLSRQVAKHNVIVSAVAPGAIYTEGRYFAKLRNEDPAMLQKYLDENLPIGRLGEPQDIAPAVALLCSEQASFMAGSIVAIDGAGK